jgi:hypothetical protein
MGKVGLLRGVDFEERGEVKLDAKRRVSLGPRIAKDVSDYRVYSNSAGQIILDPLATIPAYELWLFRSKTAARMVREGLEDARKRRLVGVKEDYTRYRDESD